MPWALNLHSDAHHFSIKLEEGYSALVSPSFPNLWLYSSPIADVVSSPGILSSFPLLSREKDPSVVFYSLRAIKSYSKAIFQHAALIEMVNKDKVEVNDP